MRLLTKQICSSQTKIMIILLLLMGIKRDKGNGEIQESRKWMNVLRARFGKCLIPGDIISMLWQGDMWTLSLMWWRLLARSQDTPRLSVSHSLLWRETFSPAPHRRPLISGGLSQPRDNQRKWRKTEKLEINVVIMRLIFSMKGKNSSGKEIRGFTLIRRPSQT